MTLLQTVFAQIHQECAEQIQESIRRQDDIALLEKTAESAQRAGIQCAPSISTGNGRVTLFLNIDYTDCDTQQMREILAEYGLELSTSHHKDQASIHTEHCIGLPFATTFQFYNTPREAVQVAA